jgi:hypothetical protein
MTTSTTTFSDDCPRMGRDAIGDAKPYWVIDGTDVLAE